MMKFLQILRTLLTLTKKDIHGLLKGKHEFNPDVFIDPIKYSRRIATEKIVADSKVSRQGIEFYKKKIANNEKLDPIIVVKHPRKDLYAVLDGHHRYYAYREMGKKTVDSAIAGDYSSVNFYLTENGYFQPQIETTEKLIQPAKKLHENLKQFLDEFLSEENIRREIEKKLRSGQKEVKP